MALDSYAALKIEIENHLEHDLEDADADTLIDLAEARHKREVRIRDMITRSSITVDSRQISLPSGFLEMITLRLLTDPVTVLEEVNYYQMNRVRDEGTGKPKWFVVGGEIEFDIAPDDSYSGEIVFYTELTALSSANTSNAILSRAPDLYLYGALLAAEPFLGADERIQVWNSFYTSALAVINGQDRKRAGPLVSRVVGARP